MAYWGAVLGAPQSKTPIQANCSALAVSFLLVEPGGAVHSLKKPQQTGQVCQAR